MYGEGVSPTLAPAVTTARASPPLMSRRRRIMPAIAGRLGAGVAGDDEYESSFGFGRPAVNKTERDQILSSMNGNDRRDLRRIMLGIQAESAGACSRDLRIFVPILIEEMDNTSDEAYGAAPVWLYLIGSDEKAAYHGGAGPHFLDTSEQEQAIKAVAD